MAHLRYPAKPRPGDRVAVLSPSSGLPGLFPLPHELGLERLRREFGLIPVEYPTTRLMDAAPAQRADDLHAAFTDPDIKAVITSIGGDDQISVLAHLDPEVFRAHPKPFFGYSDNTNLLAFLWNLGIVGYHGGSVMVQLGRPGAMHAQTLHSLKAALFTSGTYELDCARETGDIDRPWDDPRTFAAEPDLITAQAWTWHNADRVVEGPSWGGNLETLSHLLMAGRQVKPNSAYAGHVLFLETSEELPDATYVYRVLRSMGERGLLEQFPALLMGRAKSWSFDHPHTSAEAAGYRARQREAVLSALDAYAPRMLAVFDVDLGHTDPQLVIPYGGHVRVDGPDRRITVTY